MKKLNFKLLFTCAILSIFASCAKKGCTDPLALNYDADATKDDDGCEYLVVPATYVFTDADGNNTVSYSGQTARMDMLSEMVSYLKTANGSNTSPATLDAATLLSMYDNSYTGWSDANLIDNGKQLKSKTALNDAGIQAMFEGWMTDAAAGSPDLTGSYLQAASGVEWTQMIEKEMEHHWDEAYGYFTDAPDYPTSGTDRFWGKYANKSYLEDNIGSATDISLAFRTGRAAISAGDTDAALVQAGILETEVKQMVAGMALHYLNDVKSQIAAGNAQSSINHSMSEALAFIFGIQFITDSPDMSSADVMALVNQIEPAVTGFTMSVTSVNAVIDQVAAATGLTDKKDDF